MAELTVLQKALELLTYTCETCSALVLRDSGEDHELWHDSLEYEWPEPRLLRPVEDVLLPESTALPGDELPPFPDSAYPPGAVPLPEPGVPNGVA